MRAAKNCQTLSDSPISTVKKPIARLERTSINLRPCRSATRPQIGEAKAATNEVTPDRTPAQMSIAPADCTPSSGKNSGMIGVSIENAMVMTNWMATIAHNVLRQYAETPPSSAADASLSPARSSAIRSAHARAGVHAEVDTPADRVPFRRDRHRLADRVQVAPTLGEPAFALERGAAAKVVHEIHRIARAIGGVGRGEPAAGALLQGRLAASGDGVPQLGDHRAAMGAAGFEDRVGAADRVLRLRALAQEPGRAAARLLAAGQLDQRIDPGAGDAGDDRAMVRPHPALRGQLVRRAGPARPLVVERRAEMRHDSSHRQEHVGDGPVEAAGTTQTRHVPAASDDLHLGAGEDGAPEQRASFRACARLAVFDDLEAA